MLPINEKYFRRNVGKLKKDSKYELSACCPLCGDDKNRLHLVHVTQGDYDYVKCFNSGCQVEEPTNVLSFLYHLASPDIDGYKREAFKDKVQEIKSNYSLNDLLKKVNTPKTNDLSYLKFSWINFKKLKIIQNALLISKVEK